MASRAAPWVVVAAMREELLPLALRCQIDERTSIGKRHWWQGSLAGASIDLVATGEGGGSAVRGLAAYLDRADANSESSFLLVGVAGALSRGLEPGAVVISDLVRRRSGGSELEPSRRLASKRLDAIAGSLLTVDEIVVSPHRRQMLWSEIGRPGVAAVDMETWYWARELDRRRLRWGALRVVSDGWDESLPGFLSRCVRPDGGISRGRTAVQALARPWTWASLLALRSRVRRAAVQLATVVAQEIAEDRDHRDNRRDHTDNRDDRNHRDHVAMEDEAVGDDRPGRDSGSRRPP